MIFLDTNILVDFLILPADDVDTPRARAVFNLCESIEFGREKALISEVVLHETFFVIVLRSKALTVSNFCEVFRDILSWQGWAFEDQEIKILRTALGILQQFPKLEFSDSVIAARAQANGAELATFDARLAKAYGGVTWNGD